LLESPRADLKVRVATALFSLLESSQPLDARKLITKAGDDNFEDGAKQIRKQIEPTTTSGPDGPKFRSRILDWQKRTFIDLGFK